MAGCTEDIYRRIPHRPPFLWVDKIIGQTSDSIETEKLIPVDLDIFAGHYPDHPIMPGVILCEAVFQSGALLISNLINKEDLLSGQVPVLTRIIGAKFKREVKPGDTINMQVQLKEKVGPAWFMKGKVLVQDKVVMSLEFACTFK